MRPSRREVFVAALLIVLAVVELVLGTVLDQVHGIDAFSYAGAVVAAAATALVRSRPRISWITGIAGYLVVLGTTDGEALVPYLAAWYLVFSAGRRDGGRASALSGVALAVGGIGVASLAGNDASMYSFLAPLIWLAGRAVRDREQVAARLEERAAELEAEREAYARLSVRYERARIAADLHDIVAHALSVMVVQAGAGQRLAAVDPELTAETFDAIAEAARQAEQDMGRLVALLGDEEAIGPAPDLALVEELVARAAGSGLDVTLRLEGEREGLPAEVVETAYRIVQESLTNALRYANGAPVRVLVRGDREDVRVEVANDPATGPGGLIDAGTGNGLRGLRERTSALGGTFDAGPDAGGGWHVAALLPRRSAVAPAV